MSEKNTQSEQKETQPQIGTTSFVERSDGRIMPMKVTEIEDGLHKTFDENNQPTEDRLYTMVGTVPEILIDDETGNEMSMLPTKKVLGSLLTESAQLALEEKLMEKLTEPAPMESTQRELGKVSLGHENVSEELTDISVYKIPTHSN